MQPLDPNEGQEGGHRPGNNPNPGSAPLHSLCVYMYMGAFHCERYICQCVHLYMSVPPCVCRFVHVNELVHEYTC